MFTFFDHTAAVVAAYDFSVGGTVVDVGGGHGTLLIAILSAYPGIRGVPFERESVAVGAREHIEAAGLSSRCAVQAGDFFQSVPRDGGIYLLSHIVYNWDDHRCGKILAKCRAAMPSGARLLILGKVLPDQFDPGRAAVQASMADLHMLAITGGQERTVEEYRHLLATGGFTLTNLIGTAVADSLVEAVPN